MNLLFSMDRNYIPVFRNCFRSILKNGGADHYDVYILHSDLEDSHMEQIRAIDPDTSFHFVEVDPAMFEGFPVSNRYPLQIYYRLAAPLLLPDLDRILYLDGDTIIINSLNELYNMDFEGNCLIGCSHTGMVMNTVNQVRLGMDTQVPYINSGVMLYNLPELRKVLSMPNIREYANVHDMMLILPDQDILTALYGSRVKIADWRKYNLGEKSVIKNNLDPTKDSIDLDWIRENTSIIHYFGKNKPWKDNYNGSLGIFYDEIVKTRTLYIITGTMGSGKTTVSRILNQKLPSSVMLDGDWLWDAKPYIVNDVTKIMVLDNIAYVLNNFIHSGQYENMIFCWVLDEQSVYEQLLTRLDIQDVKVIPVSLIPDTSSLIAHLQKEMDEGKRDESIVERSLARLPRYYYLNRFKIKCRNKDPQAIASQILELQERA